MAIKGLDDVIRIATISVPKKSHYCLKYNKYLGQGEINSKKCIEIRCKDYIEVDDREKSGLEKDMLDKKLYK